MVQVAGSDTRAASSDRRIAGTVSRCPVDQSTSLPGSATCHAARPTRLTDSGCPPSSPSAFIRTSRRTATCSH